MDMMIDIFIMMACLAGLWFGANWLVEGAVSIAVRLGVSDLVIGLTIVSIGTSAPEFAVSVISALKGHADISVGNVVGSNIFNLGFILGGIALIHPVATSRALVMRDGFVLIGTTFLLLFLLRDLHLSFWEGLLLMGILVTYVLYLVYQRQAPSEDCPAGQFKWFSLPQLLIGLMIIVASSHFLVDSASDVARSIGISEWVIGVTIVAMGTSTPELVTSLVAVLRGHPGLSAGNLLGSDIFNLLGVLGLAGVVQSMTVTPEALGSLYLLSGMVVTVVVMMRTGWRISGLEGGILLGMALVRWILDFTS